MFNHRSTKYNIRMLKKKTKLASKDLVTKRLPTQTNTRGLPELPYRVSEDGKTWAKGGEQEPWTTKENLRTMRGPAQVVKQPAPPERLLAVKNLEFPILTPLENHLNLTFCKISIVSLKTNIYILYKVKGKCKVH